MPLLDPASPPRSLLLVRLGSRGDVVFASAMIPALRARFPEARLGWVVEEEAAELVRHHPLLDRVVVMPRGRWKDELRRGRIGPVLRGVRAFVRELRAERYDVVLDLQGILRSGLVARLSRARRRIGLGSKEGSGLFMHEVVPSTGHPHGGRISSQYYHLALELGLPPGGFPMSVVLPKETEEAGEALLAREGLHAGGYLLLIPFTTRPQKHWFAERWARLAEIVTERTGRAVVVVGAPGDRPAM